MRLVTPIRKTTIVSNLPVLHVVLAGQEGDCSDSFYFRQINICNTDARRGPRGKPQRVRCRRKPRCRRRRRCSPARTAVPTATTDRATILPTTPSSIRCPSKRPALRRPAASPSRTATSLNNYGGGGAAMPDAAPALATAAIQIPGTCSVGLLVLYSQLSRSVLRTDLIATANAAFFRTARARDKTHSLSSSPQLQLFRTPPNGSGHRWRQAPAR